MAPDRAVWAPPDTRRVGATRYAPCGRHPIRAVWAPPDTRRVGATRYAPCGRHPIRAVWAPPDSGGAHNTVGISGPEDAPALLAVAERGVVVVAAVPAGTGLCGLGLSGPLVRLQRRGGVPGLDALWFGVYRLPLRLSRWRLVGLGPGRSEEYTSELQSPVHLVCRLLLEKKKNTMVYNYILLTNKDNLYKAEHNF